MNTDRTPQYIKLDERNHVEKPLLDQLEGLDWEIIDLDHKQHPADSHRDSFTEVVMPAVLREQLKVINPLYRRLPVQGANLRHRTPHYSGHRAFLKWATGCGDRV